MIPLIIFVPLVAAVAILVGAPARKTALTASIFTLGVTLLTLALFNGSARGFQQVVSVPISADWGLNFAVGLDGLSLVMILLAAIVTVAGVWFRGRIDKQENAFYACLLFISGGAIGAFASDRKSTRLNSSHVSESRMPS